MAEHLLHDVKRHVDGRLGAKRMPERMRGGAGQLPALVLGEIQLGADLPHRPVDQLAQPVARIADPTLLILLSLPTSVILRTGVPTLRRPREEILVRLAVVDREGRQGRAAPADNTGPVRG